jgi:hypothetical protein
MAFNFPSDSKSHKRADALVLIGDLIWLIVNGQINKELAKIVTL